MTPRTNTEAHIAHIAAALDDLHQERDNLERQASILALPWVVTSATLEQARADVQGAIPLLRRTARLSTAIAIVEAALETLKMLDKDAP
jgi:hypothetical protein